MKIWLNDLKPGDRFWSYTNFKVLQYEIISEVNNMNYRMPRYNCKILTKPYEGLETELFVNQNVYDNPKEVYEIVIQLLTHAISIENNFIKDKRKYINELKNTLIKSKMKLKEYKNI